MEQGTAQAPGPDSELFCDVFNASPIGIGVRNLEGQLLFANRFLCSMLWFNFFIYVLSLYKIPRTVDTANWQSDQVMSFCSSYLVISLHSYIALIYFAPICRTQAKLSKNPNNYHLEEKAMKNATRILTMCLVALVLSIARANAAVEVNDKTNINLTVFIPCAAGGAGEVVDLSGPLQSLISFTINGNNVSSYFHFQPQGISGTGETTGDKYQATGVTQESFKNSLQNGQANLTFVNNFRIIGQGPGNNFLVHETMHITINAEGAVTVSRDNFIVDGK